MASASQLNISERVQRTATPKQNPKSPERFPANSRSVTVVVKVSLASAGLFYPWRAGPKTRHPSKASNIQTSKLGPLFLSSGHEDHRLKISVRIIKTQNSKSIFIFNLSLSSPSLLLPLRHALIPLLDLETGPYGY